MRKPVLGCLLLLPLAAFARDHCEHSRPLDLNLDLAGVSSVAFEIGPHDLKLDAASNAKAGLHGRACASSKDRLKELSVTQQRHGDRLVVSMKREDSNRFSLFGRNYAYLELQGTLPDNIPVEINVGSGDAVVSAVAGLAVKVGSGDAIIRNIPGAVTANVGSGDIELDEVGSLRVGSIGSGDLQGRRITGDAIIGSIGSGDAGLSDIGGNVEVGSIGSGDLEVNRVGGTLSVSVIGSGDVDHRGVKGAIDLPEAK